MLAATRSRRSRVEDRNLVVDGQGAGGASLRCLVGAVVACQGFAPNPCTCRAPLSVTHRLSVPRVAPLSLHVHETAHRTLEGHGDDVGGPVAVLGDDEVGFPRPWGRLVVRVLAVQEDHDVRILFQ